MQAIFKFELPDDQYDLDVAMNANRYKSAIEEMLGCLRHISKYEPDNYTQKQIDLVEELKGKFYEIIRDNSIEI